MLLLDEFPLFAADILDALRQPLEAGEVTIARGEETATYPARGMFVLACNPCPCGNFTTDPSSDRCSCLEVQRRDYRRKLGGPVMDRIDITRQVRPVPGSTRRTTRCAAPSPRRWCGRGSPRRGGCSSSGTPACRGGSTDRPPGPLLREEWPLSLPAAALLDTEMYAGRLTRRGATRVHRVAWTVADLRGVDQPGQDELRVALRLRSGEPLELAALEHRRVS